MKVFIKILKIIAGILLGLVFSFVTIVCINEYEESSFRIILYPWLIALIVAGWVFFVLWLILRKSSAKKIKTDGIENLPVSISELINGIIDAMKYRRSVRAEVRQELTDHFTDALAECETKEEKQTATKELIEAFGDIELLGKLLRRAKKRCRPLWRTMVARAFQFLGLCVVLLILYVGWFFTGKPQITTNYLEIMNQQVRPVADDNQNAWPFYKEAADKYVQYEQPEEKDQQVDFSPRKVIELTEKDRQAILQSIKDNLESLSLIRQGNQKPYYWRDYGVYDSDHPQLISITLTHLNEFKKLTYLICWQGLLATERGNYKEALDTAIEAYSFGDHLRGQNGTFIEQLVAMSIESVSRETLLIMLSEYAEQIDEKVLDSTRKRLADMIEEKDFTVDYEFEKMFMYDEAQRCFTKSRFGKSHLYLKRIEQFGPLWNSMDTKVILSEWFNIIFTHPDKEETLKQVERLYSKAEEKAAMTPASARLQGVSVEEIAVKATEKNVFMAVLMPALTKVSQIAYRVRTQAEAALVVIALVQYEKEHAEYPESLDVLVEKGLLKEVPIDPFSDKPLIYRKTDDNFILYSVGLNFVDDGCVLGKCTKCKKPHTKNWGDNGDGIFWPVNSVISQQ